MPLYLLNRSLKYPTVGSDIHEIFEDRIDIEQNDSSKKKEILDYLKDFKGINKSEVVFHGAVMVYLNPDAITALPRPVNLIVDRLLPPEYRIVIECSEDELMMMKLGGNMWLECGYHEVSKDYLDRPRINGI